MKLYIQKIYSEHFTNKSGPEKNNISSWRSQQYGNISSSFSFLPIVHVVYSPMWKKKIYPLWQVLILVGYRSTNPVLRLISNTSDSMELILQWLTESNEIKSLNNIFIKNNGIMTITFIKRYTSVYFLSG